MTALSQEDYVIIGAMVLGFASASAMYVFGFPPVLIAISIGITVSALTYRFLGGVTGTSFDIGNLRVAGAAALLVGTAWWANAELKTEMPATSSAQIRNAHNTIRDQAEQIQTLNQSLSTTKSRLTDIEKKLTDAQVPRKLSVSEAIEIVKGVAPGSSEAKQLITMAQNGDGPWHVDKTETRVTIAAADYLGGMRAAACPSLNYGPNTVVTVTSLLKVNGVQYRAEEPTAVAGWERITANDCASDKTLEIQMSCPLLREIFTERVVTCDKNNQSIIHSGFTNSFPAAVTVQ